MLSFIRSISQQWNYLMTEASDPRSRGWFMAGSPIPVILLLFFYQRFVTKIGPELMKDRKPFNIDKIIQVYNLFQVAICAWLSYESFRLTFGPWGSYSWRCQPIGRNDTSPTSYWLVHLTWMYYMVKLLDLLDTVFFVMRKKFNQISFLHVYHHIGVTVLGYMATKYYPDGQGYILLPMNCFVHTFMYMYYFLTNYNPEYKKNLWWKKYITQLQMVQFVILFCHIGKVLLLPDCDYPRFPLILYLPQNILIFVLFFNFYVKTYIKPKQPVKSS